MQQMSSQEQSQPDESAMLGERYQLGALVGAHYVFYTRADIRRYRLVCFFLIFSLAYLVFAVLNLVSIFTNWPFHSNGYIPLLYIGNMFFWLYTLSARRKWGNWPVLNPNQRQQRVYIYQNGLVKLTNRQCDVVRWSEVSNVNYTPLQIPDPQGPKWRYFTISQRIASMQIMRQEGKKVVLSGALFNFDGIARFLSYHVNMVVM